MRVSKSWEKELDRIEAFIYTDSFKKIGPYILITIGYVAYPMRTSMFLQGHLGYVIHNQGNPTYLEYLERLLNFVDGKYPDSFGISQN